MSQRRMTPLDALERRLTGPRRIALFGHRNVGKTTLLAMFYRQASTGMVPGVRLAAVDPPSAEYLAEKIAQIESGQPPAGTLAETELKLRLYHGPARLDLIVKDYQGEHVALGADEQPIHAFFADCDAVLLCLDPEGSAQPADRRRRQQEIEYLLERYIEASDDGTAGRPVALVLTKFDRLLAKASGLGLDQVERLVEARYGMTAHALAKHVPNGAMFAVSAYGRSAVDSRPPAELEPMGLEGPLVWLAEQLEVGDRDRLDWIWELAPGDLGRLARCVDAYEKRYPKSEHAAAYRRKLAVAKSKRRRSRLVRGAVGLALLAGGLAFYDAYSYRQALAFERDTENAAPAIAARWESVLAWHPSLPYFWPEAARQAQKKHREWAVKDAETQVALGTDRADLGGKLTALKSEAPTLAPAIRKVEAARDMARHDERWRAVNAEVAASPDQPEAVLKLVRGFLREFPDSPRRDEAGRLLTRMQTLIDDRVADQDRRSLNEIVRASTLPNPDLKQLIEDIQKFKRERPQSRHLADADIELERLVKLIDDLDIQRARDYSRQNPTYFSTRIERYQTYLKEHVNGGRYISEALEAKDRILKEWDNYTYRLAYDHYLAHPDDIAEVARRLTDYRRDHKDGRYAKEAKEFADWWAKISVPGTYKVTLRRGEFDPAIVKYLSGGGPDLSVEVEVAGTVYGPSPVIANNIKPIWDFTFPKPITWKVGDPITIRVVDHDWSDSPVYTLNSRKGDPLTLRLLSGAVKPSKGGPTQLVFSSDFEVPSLPKPEEK